MSELVAENREHDDDNDDDDTDNNGAVEDNDDVADDSSDDADADTPKPDEQEEAVTDRPPTPPRMPKPKLSEVGTNQHMLVYPPIDHSMSWCLCFVQTG